MKMKKLSREIMDAIIKDLNSQSMDSYRSMIGEDTFVVVDGKKYGVYILEGEDDWDDDGKYSENWRVGRIYLVSDDYRTVEEYDNYLSQSISRTGSYYSDYYYTCYPVEEVYPKEVTRTITETIWNKVGKDDK